MTTKWGIPPSDVYVRNFPCPFSFFNKTLIPHPLDPSLVQSVSSSFQVFLDPVCPLSPVGFGPQLSLQAHYLGTHSLL